MNTYTVYGTLYNGEETFMYVKADSKAKALESVEENYSGAFYPEYIMLMEYVNG